ncbi:hypothetical protein CDIK_2028 [Cucumispora dikerogammari]|nr:hypothetical protein CDIK_2028 [Cucumispora dikerogammari]
MGMHRIRTEYINNELPAIYYKGYIKSRETTQIKSEKELKKELNMFRENLFITGYDMKNVKFTFLFSFPITNKIDHSQKIVKLYRGKFFFEGNDTIKLSMVRKTNI